MGDRWPLAFKKAPHTEILFALYLLFCSCIILSYLAILLVAICKEGKDMDKQIQKALIIVGSSVAGVALLGGVFYMVWNSKQVKTMRTIHRTNMIMRRVGNVLCKIAAADEACM